MPTRKARAGRKQSETQKQDVVKQSDIEDVEQTSHQDAVKVQPKLDNVK